MSLRLSYLELPKAVQEKYNCLVSKGNRNGKVLVNTPLQVGKALLANTKGSCRQESNVELTYCKFSYKFSSGLSHPFTPKI